MILIVYAIVGFGYGAFNFGSIPSKPSIDSFVEIINAGIVNVDAIQLQFKTADMYDMGVKMQIW